MQEKRQPPVTPGQHIELQIDRLNHDGEGVGRFEGFTIFVPNTTAGDKIIARVITLQKGYARALLQSVLSTSPTRITPPCDHYDACGGCQLQHIDYQEQLRLKTDLVRDALTRIGGLSVPVLPTIGMDNPWHYRNKAQVPIGQDQNTIRAGFYEKRSHNIVDLTHCHIQHPANDDVVHTVRRILTDLHISIYNEKEHTGLVRHLLARTSFTTNEVMVVIITNGPHFPQAQQFVERLRHDIPNISAIIQNINTRRGNTILGDTEKTLWGCPYLTESLGKLQFHLSPRSFFQVNPTQTEVLYTIAKEYAALTGTQTVFDLYSGIGTISLFIADSATKVVGVEIVEAAVKDAQQNAQLNKITNTEFHTGAAEVVVPKLYKQGYKADVVIVDPPRKGCEEILLQTMISMQPERIVYISCNPSTLARDLKYLTANGYTLNEVQPIDMFPHTSHVEAVVCLHRKHS